MKRTILAALSALCLAGAALAEKADYPLTYTTFGTSGEVAVVVANTGSAPTLTLTGAAFARTITVAEGDERPINFNPTALTVTSVTLAFASQTAYSTSFTLNGVAFGNPTVGAAIAVPSSAGDRTVWPVTYTCAEAEGVPLETGTSYALDRLGQGLGGSQASYYTVGGVLHAEVVGTATLDRHVIDVPVSGTMDLSDALGAGFADTQDTVVVAEFGEAGGTLVMDQTLAKAAFVAGSAATGNTAVIQFVEGVAQTGPFTLRDGGEAQGRIVLEGPTGAVWDPAAFLLRCDLTLRAPLPASLGAVTIPAGRTVRLELPADAVFPDLRFGDAASRLELASKGTSIPAKYLGSDMGAAGVLALEQAVSANTVTVGGTGRIGTLELNGGYAFSFGTLVLVGEGAAFRQNGGTASVSRLTLNASATTIDVVGGALTVGTVGGFAPNTNVDLAVGPGGTLTLNQGIAAGNDNSSLEITVAGTLVLGRDLVMTPAARRALTLDGGTIRAASAAEVVNGATGADAENENFMEVTANGGTLAGALTVDGLRGPNGGTLTLDESVSVGTVLDYIGVIRGGKGIGQIAGSLGDVTLGEPWGGGDLGALATEIAADYRGTLGFTAGEEGNVKTIDFASVDGLTALPGAFRINDNQHIIMRLDQYADATIRWPDAPQGVTLTLIESGAYGGTVTLPHIPGLGEGVTLEFASFDASAPGGWALRPPADFDVVSDESGVTDTLTWDDPVFTGEGAWIDVEFDGDTRNTGWFTLTDQDNATVDEDGRTTNGLLCGLPGGTGEGRNPFGDKVMYGSISVNERDYTAEDYFSEVRHPYNAKGGLALYYRPYVAMKSSLVYPETWSLSVRLTTPNAGHRCLIAFGNNDYTGNNPELDNCNALVLATGETDNEIVLYRFSGRRAIDGGAATAQPSEVLFRKTVADATSAAHTVSVVYDGETMAFYLDGAYIDATAPGALEGFRLGRGLQVGAQIGGQGVVPDAFWELAYPPSEAEGGVIDYIRFYKGALTDVAMQEIADRTPYVRENLRYVRKVPAAGYTDDEGKHIPECWIQTGAWLEQTWDNEQKQWVDGETTDQPAEGAECRLLVAPGSYTIQVNVERQVQAFDEDGQLVNQGRYFYSPNRNYATLVVAPQEGAGNAGTLHLTPLGVTADEGATAANRTGFRYGRLRFTGGAEDAFSDDTTTIEDFHGAGYLLKDASGCYDAGACYFSKYANMVLPDAEAGVLRLVAGMSLTRGVVDEVARWQLTGPVVVEGSAASDRVQGHEDVGDDQASEDVWVPFFTANSSWKFYDDTRLAVNGGEANVDGAETGLFARGVQTPGRLYLDFTVDKVAEGGAFSTQAWYRYGYNGAAEGAETPSGMAPVAASADDFLQAVAFQIRLAKEVGDVTLTLDQLPTAQVQTFYVEEEAEPPEQPLTLRLKTAKGVGPLVIHRMVVAAARLDVSNEGSDSGNALSLTPGEGLHVPVHRGPDTAGRGAFIVGDMTMDWDFGRESSVARLEVAPGHTLTFRSGQDFRTYGTTLVAQERATIHHTSAAPLLGQDVELHKDATFGFHAEAASQGADVSAEGVVLEGALTLRGSATLRASQDGGADDARLPHFTAAGGIVAAAFDLTLTVEAPEGVTWHSHTGRLEGEGFGLCKTGPGTVDFYLQTPPSVTGPVAVEAGTLRVAMAADTPIGAYGLHVEKDATLADNGLMQGSVGTLARIPNGQTLSGTGTIADGRLRLEQGATYQASAEGALTAEAGIETDSVEGANITVALPDGYEADKPFLVAGREERAVRRRLRSMREGVRWDTVAWIEGGQTSYAARPAQIPAPTDAGDDPGVYDDALHGSLVNHYQGNGVAYVGAAQGRTQAKTKHLNASELSDVFYAFSGVYALLPSAQTDAGREWIDAHNLHVAYEFGIDAMAFAQINGEEHVVVRVRVRNALRESFDHLKDVTAPALDAEADFRATATLRLADAKGTALEEAFEVADLTGKEKTARASAEPGVRYLALPVAKLPEDGRLRAHVDPVRPSQGE